MNRIQKFSAFCLLVSAAVILSTALYWNGVKYTVFTFVPLYWDSVHLTQTGAGVFQTISGFVFLVVAVFVSYGLLGWLAYFVVRKAGKFLLPLMPLAAALLVLAFIFRVALTLAGVGVKAGIHSVFVPLAWGALYESLRGGAVLETYLFMLAGLVVSYGLLGWLIYAAVRQAGETLWSFSPLILFLFAVAVLFVAIFVLSAGDGDFRTPYGILSLITALFVGYSLLARLSYIAFCKIKEQRGSLQLPSSESWMRILVSSVSRLSSAVRGMLSGIVRWAKKAGSRTGT